MDQDFDTWLANEAANVGITLPPPQPVRKPASYLSAVAKHQPPGALRAIAGLADEWAATEQPIEQRGLPMEGAADQGLLGMLSVPRLLSGVAPFGKYEDGSYHLAKPPMLQDFLDAWDRAGQGPGQQNPEDALVIGGSLGIGGLAAPRPRNALAANSVRQEAPAAVNAVEQQTPRGITDWGPIPERTWFHGTASPESFSTLHPSSGGRLGPGVYVARRPEAAAAYAEGDGGRLYPAHVKGELMDQDAHQALFEAMGENEQATIDEAVRRGYVGAKLATGDGVVANIFKPGSLISKTTGETLFSNPKESALAPGLVNALDQQTPKGVGYADRVEHLRQAMTNLPREREMAYAPTPFEHTRITQLPPGTPKWLDSRREAWRAGPSEKGQVDLSTLKTEQASIDPYQVNQFKDGNTFNSDLPFVYRLPTGEHVVQDGNHRLAAAALRGDKQALVDLYYSNPKESAFAPAAVNALADETLFSNPPSAAPLGLLGDEFEDDRPPSYLDPLALFRHQLEQELRQIR